MKNTFLLFALVLITINKLYSQSGTLDLSFGDKGKVLQPGAVSPANAIIIRPGGKILVGSGDYSFDAAAFLQKQFLAEGSLDSSFGKDGQVTTQFGNGVGGYIKAMATTADDKIIAVGIGGLDAFNNRGADVLMAKYNDDGTLDSAFGKNGLVVKDFGLFEYANCIQLQKDNKIIVGGSCCKSIGGQPKNNFFIARFNADGSVDSSFGNKGKVVTDIGLSFGSVINSMALNADGSFIVAGMAEYLSGSTGNKILLAKYSSDGKLNTTFGIDGLVFTNPSDGADYANAVAVQDDGKIVAAGVTGASSLNHAGMCISRYNADGTIDKSFNQTGVLIIYFDDNNSIASSLLLLPDGKYLLGGTKSPGGFTPDQSAYDFALALVTKEGSLNTDFGTQGIVTTDFSGLQDYGSAIALQPDGKIIVAGGSNDSLGTIGYISIARYNNDLSKQQPLITKIRRWLQHRNGFTWDANSNISSYAVQRSYDGIHFNSIAKIHTGNASNYTYADPSPLSGTNYYRLQTTSVNGAVNYSNILAVGYQPLAISISPNPAKNVLQIQGLASKQKIKLSVVDLSGNIALSFSLSALSSAYNLNIAQLKPGNYLLKIETNDDVVTKKFVKE